MTMRVELALRFVPHCARAKRKRHLEEFQHETILPPNKMPIFHILSEKAWRTCRYSLFLFLTIVISLNASSILKLPSVESTVTALSKHNATRLNDWPPIPRKVLVGRDFYLTVLAVRVLDQRVERGVLEFVSEATKDVESGGPPDSLMPSTYRYARNGQQISMLGHSSPITRQQAGDVLDKVWALVEVYGPADLLGSIEIGGDRRSGFVLSEEHW